MNLYELFEKFISEISLPNADLFTWDIRKIGYRTSGYKYEVMIKDFTGEYTTFIFPQSTTMRIITKDYIELTDKVANIGCRFYYETRRALFEVEKEHD